MKEKKKMSAAAKNEAMWGWLFIAPTMLGLIILNFYPAFNTVYQSFCKTGDFGKGNKFVGLANYERVLTSSETWGSLAIRVCPRIWRKPQALTAATSVRSSFQKQFVEGIATSGGKL